MIEALDDYQKQAVETAIYKPIGHPCIYPALGLANECGEVLGKVKKVFRDHDGQFTEDIRKAIAGELGDCLWYLAVLAKEMDYTLKEIAEINIKKLSSRKEKGTIKGDGDNR